MFAAISMRMAASTAGFWHSSNVFIASIVLQPVDEEHARTTPDLEAMLLKLQSYRYHQEAQAVVQRVVADIAIINQHQLPWLTLKSILRLPGLPDDFVAAQVQVGLRIVLCAVAAT